MFTGKFRFRKSFFGRQILQVQYSALIYRGYTRCIDDLEEVLRWRDATPSEAKLLLQHIKPLTTKEIAAENMVS